MSKSNKNKHSIESRIIQAPADVLKSYTGTDVQTLRVLHRLLKDNLSHKFGRPFDASALRMLVLTLHRLKSGGVYRDFYLSLNVFKDAANRIFDYVSEWLALVDVGDHSGLPHRHLRGHAKPKPRYVAVDTTAIWVRSSDRATYSRKHGKKIVKVQAIVDEAGSVMHVSDGYLGSCHDKTIFEAEQATEAEFDRELQIIAQLIEQEVPVLGDKAYLASDIVIIPHKRNTKVYRELPELCKAYNKHHGRKRVVVENAFARIKQFRMLQGLFRDNISTVGRIFKAIVNVIELQKKVAQFATDLVPQIP